MAEKQLMLTIRIPAERKKQIRQWMLDHDISKIQHFVENAIALALGETKRPKNVAKKGDTADTELAYNLHIPEYREWVDFVVDIFNSGNVKDVKALIGNIDAFKRGNQFDELAPVLAHVLKLLEELLKKEGISPDATITSSITEATNLTRSLTRARDSIKSLKTHEEGSGKRASKHTG